MTGASNLGQIIGRLLYGEPAASLSSTPQAESAAAAPRAQRRCRGGKAKLIANLLARSPRALTAREIADALDMDANSVCAYLCQMPELEKLDAARPYTWRLRG